MSAPGAEDVTRAGTRCPSQNSTVIPEAAWTRCAAVRILPSREIRTPEPTLKTVGACPSSAGTSISSDRTTTTERWTRPKSSATVSAPVAGIMLPRTSTMAMRHAELPGRTMQVSIARREPERPGATRDCGRLTSQVLPARRVRSGTHSRCSESLPPLGCPRRGCIRGPDRPRSRSIVRPRPAARTCGANSDQRRPRR